MRLNLLIVIAYQNSVFYCCNKSNQQVSSKFKNSEFYLNFLMIGYDYYLVSKVNVQVIFLDSVLSLENQLLKWL